jgi:hypothetical protein
VLGFVDQASPAGQFELGYAFLDRASCYAEEVFAIRFGEATVAFGDVRGDRQCGSVELVVKEALTALELFGSHANSVSEIDRLLVYQQFLEGERHGSLQRWRRG